MSLSDSRVLVTALVAACVIIVALVVQIRSVRDDLAIERTENLSMPEGTYIPFSPGLSVAGDSVVVGEVDSEGQLLFVYNTRCPYCLRSIDAWNSLARRLDPNVVEVTGISMDSIEATSTYRQENALDFESAVLLDARMKDAYRFRTVPQTILVNSEGRVVLSRVGVLRHGPAVDSIMEAVRTLSSESADGRRLIVVDSIPF
ncbi:MAG: redoxin domain-containing protein [Longimicrobiales bacterium]